MKFLLKGILIFKALVITLLFPFTVIILGPTAILLHFIFHDRKIDDRMIVIWGRVCCWLAGVTVLVEGLENIPPDQGCLFLFNHSSFFDVFAIAGFIPGVRFGAKAELFNIPIFGNTMAAMGTLPIARNNREEVYKIYDGAKTRIKNKEKFALAPEGGRFFGPQLSPFKAGPFLFAMSAEAPVVPVVILGAYETLAKGQILFNKDKWTRTIFLKILKPIETTGFKTESRHDLQKIVYDQMNPIWTNYYRK